MFVLFTVLKLLYLFIILVKLFIDITVENIIVVVSNVNYRNRLKLFFRTL